MRQLLTAIVLIAIFLVFSFSTPTYASVNMADAGTFFNDEAYGFEGKIRLTCQAKGEDVADTISAIVTAAESESIMSLFTNSLKFAHISNSFMDECGSYMKDDKREVLNALVNFANSLVGEDSDS